MGLQFYDQDFSNQDLSRADFRRATLFNCKFDSSDLSYANFGEANLYMSSFVGSKLYHTDFKDAVLAGCVLDPRDMMGMTITMDCNTFDKLRLSTKGAYSLLFLMCTMDLDPAMKKKLADILGAERIQSYEKVFKVRVL